MPSAFSISFPGRVLYAVKCNPHPEVLKALYNAGIRHFDTASLPEIAQVRESFGDAACYFMHPVKGRAVINTSARVYEIDTFVIDHMDELEKILKETGGAEGLTIYVRIKTPPAEGTLYHLAAKFGAEVAEAAAMLKEAQSRGCQTGIAFHVGSQCLSPEAYTTALKIVGEVLDQAKVQIAGLDVGGGFPAAYLGTNMPPLEDFVSAIEAGVKQLGLRRDCVLMCEPGRALVAHAISVVTQVQLRKGDQLYINDGIYGSLSETVDAGLKLPARLVRIGEDSRAPRPRLYLERPDLRFTGRAAVALRSAGRRARRRLDRDRSGRRLFQRAGHPLQRLPSGNHGHRPRPHDDSLALAERDPGDDDRGGDAGGSDWNPDATFCCRRRGGRRHIRDGLLLQLAPHLADDLCGRCGAVEAAGLAHQLEVPAGYARRRL